MKRMYWHSGTLDPGISFVFAEPGAKRSPPQVFFPVFSSPSKQRRPCRHEHTWRMALAMPELEKQWRSARDLRGHGARPHGRRGHQRPRPAPAWRPTARAHGHVLIWTCAAAPPSATSPMSAAPRRARHGIARDEPSAWPHEQFALPGLAQTAPSPRHRPTRQVASPGRRRPACALLPLRHRLRGSDAASRPRGRRGRGTADTSAPPFARGVGRPRWCARRAAAAMACVLGALEPRGHAALRRLAARLLRS